jgi:predicted O-methyltransferase YrrM
MRRTAAQRLNALEGLVSAAVGECLYELARDVPADQAIVEIGSYKGKSSCYLGEGARDGNGAKVHCIDPWDLAGNVNGRHGFADADTSETWKRQVASQKLSSRVTAHRAFAHDYVKRWKQPIGLLFIDGSHEYEDVKQDFEDWSPFVVSGAPIVFDDYGTRNHGVTRFVDAHGQRDEWDFSTPPLAIARAR